MEDEEIVYTEKYVLENFEQSMEAVKHIYEKQAEEALENSVEELRENQVMDYMNYNISQEMILPIILTRLPDILAQSSRPSTWLKYYGQK